LLFANVLKGGGFDQGPCVTGSGAVFLRPEFAFGHLRAPVLGRLRLLQRGEVLVKLKPP